MGDETLNDSLLPTCEEFAVALFIHFFYLPNYNKTRMNKGRFIIF